MYLAACGALLAFGLFLNRSDSRMLALTAMVGASVFFPVPSYTAEIFYSFCFASEIGVALAAFFVRNIAGLVTMELCALLAVTHMMGYEFDGSQPFSPYRYIVKLLEVSQLVVCVAFAPKARLQSLLTLFRKAKR